MKKIGQSGQSTVEYVLLLLAVMVILKTLFQSGVFLRFLGPRNQVALWAKTFLETTYRHTLRQGSPDSDYGGYQGKHDSYYGDNTRFFLPLSAYPETNP